MLELPVLAPLCTYPRFRAHQVFSRHDHEHILRHELLQALAGGGEGFGLFEDGAPLAICLLSRLAWDSAHFGIPMGRIQVCAGAGVASATVAGLLRHALGQATGVSEVLHWSADVDIDDYACLNGLLAVGAEVLDLKRSYAATRRPFPRDMVRGLRGVRPFCSDDHAAVADLFRSATFESRFTRDRLLPAEKVRKMYEVWLEKLLGCHDTTAMVLVMERAGEVVACGAIDEFDLSPSGVRQKMMMGGLYACNRRGVGAYLPVMHELTVRSLERHGAGETTVSLNNEAASRVLDSLRVYRVVTRYALRLATPGAVVFSH